ncbi:cytochrome P450 [Lophiostoma macrostomum CBS 122681]|uniref:Cytochrome P450 n=1 Tax=Lophiostoma macrostomum CBS 122681 TaxID=1314788 RepID=A0A6A6TKB9_9PLEO|nr:cytochrome P450 [Lophiostoma macrostomum CBS 122681]
MYGRKFRAGPNLIVFNTPEAYNDIYSHKANVKRSAFYSIWRRNATDTHVFGTTDVAEHARKRRLLNLAFTDQLVKASGPFMARHIDRWHELLLGQPGERDAEGWSPTRDITLWSSWLTFDILGDLAFGAEFGTKEGDGNRLKVIPKAFDRYLRFNYPITKTPLLDWIVWLKPRGLDRLIEASTPRAIKEYYAFVEDTVTWRLESERKREAEKKPVEREDMFHFLYTARNPSISAPAFTPADLLAESSILIIAGADTTAVTISSALFYLTHNPRVYTKLSQEIRQTFTSNAEIVASPKLLTDCQYLRACIDETLRMAPGGPSEFPRQVLAGGTTIDGQHYPEGVIVGTASWALGHNDEFWDDANTFRPERWLVSSDPDSLNSAEEVSRLRRGLHTFLRGPGDCVGQKVAMLQLSMVLVRLLWCVDVRNAPGTDLGAEREDLGWGRRNPKVFQLEDAYIALRDGPLLQFRLRESC